ncbi:MAG: tetratricopeptide repeat protein [Chloroflexi bacterium]|nr:tetratricopeptide repeat protein [Chloroflexota bacterium]
MARPTRRARVRVLPTGTLTFLFSDIEGSTRLLTALGAAFGPLLERHQALLRGAFEAAGGVEVATEGDSFFVVFRSAASAVAAAAAAERALAAEPWAPAADAVRVRMGLHTGEGTLGGDNYVGIDVHRAARIAAAAHGGQVVISESTRMLVSRSLSDDLRLRDLGEYRLKDLEQPERLTQLLVQGLPEDFPSPRTLETPSNLPPQMTTFIGREREAEEVAELARRSRLVTLSGPGGTGKTRLSLQVAAQLRAEFGGGAFFVDLSPIVDPALIPTTIAAALGLREQPNRPVLESLQAHLRDLQLLLLLDNFEQVQAGAPLVGHLLEAAPQLSILVTSREVLHLRGEQEYPVPPLGLPDLAMLPPLEALSRYDAVALFIHRARAVRPDFAVDNDNAPAVAAICARLDGLPLAIELAAARVKLFAPSAILAHLEKTLAFLTSTARDLPERQRTLRGAIDWSHDLLDTTERTLFRRLSIFVGGCAADGAQAVCDPDGALGIDMLDGLASFVDKSLLTQATGDDGEPRFGMLETIREYAAERLAASDDAEPVRRRHEDLFAGLAEQAATELLGPQQKAWVDRLDADRDNLRAALQHAADDGRIELALGLGAALWRFWQRRGQLAEGRTALEGLLGRPEAASPTQARARALAGLGGVTYWQNDMVAAGQAYAEGLAIERALEEPSGLADALYNSGFVAAIGGDHATARAMYEESLEIFTRLSDLPGVLRLREALSFLLFLQGDFAEARALQEENVRAFREGAETFRVAIGSPMLSLLRAKDGEFAFARELQVEALGTFRAVGDTHSMVRVLIMAAATAVLEGDLERAATLSGAGDVLREPLGEMATPMTTLGMEDPALASRARLGDEAFERSYQKGRTLTLDQASDLLSEAGSNAGSKRGE